MTFIWRVVITYACNIVYVPQYRKLVYIASCDTHRPRNLNGTDYFPLNDMFMCTLCNDRVCLWFCAAYWMWCTMVCRCWSIMFHACRVPLGIMWHSISSGSGIWVLLDSEWQWNLAATGFHAAMHQIGGNLQLAVELPRHCVGLGGAAPLSKRGNEFLCRHVCEWLPLNLENSALNFLEILDSVCLNK